MHVIDNMVIISKIANYLIINIIGNNDIFCLNFIVCQNGNVSMHHILSCIVLSCIMLCHQQKPHGTYVLSKQRWQNFQFNYMDKTLPCSKLFLVLCLLYNNC